MHTGTTGLFVIAAALLSACAGPESVRGVDGSPPAESPAPAADLRPPPSWRSAGELVASAPPAGSYDVAEPALSIGGADRLRLEVAERCARGPTGDALVRETVADLYVRGTHPADAVDALILGRCGDLKTIVRELVEQGGEPALPLVVERATTISGIGSEIVIEQAAAEGLARHRAAAMMREPVAGASRLAGSSMGYAMVYFPLGGSGDRTQSDSSLRKLFGDATPGYGIYTYILHGAADAGGETPDALTYRELLRVIETYVLAAGSGATAPDPGAHTFLVPVQPDRGGGTLAERAGPELSAQMRIEFADYLRGSGQLELARRLQQESGPFLVSSLEPRLIPVDPDANRLLVDLSGVGPEYMYSVVDAYDRRIPDALVGQVDSLTAIRERLIEMFPAPDIDAQATPAPAGGWLYLLGPQRSARAGNGVPQTTTTPAVARVSRAAPLENYAGGRFPMSGRLAIGPIDGTTITAEGGGRTADATAP